MPARIDAEKPENWVYYFGEFQPMPPALDVREEDGRVYLGPRVGGSADQIVVSSDDRGTYVSIDSGILPQLLPMEIVRYGNVLPIESTCPRISFFKITEHGCGVRIIDRYAGELVVRNI